jgi:hypothetical protein
MSSILASLPRFHSLDWRLDVRVDQSSLDSVFRPVFVLKLTVQDADGATSDTFVEADYADVQNLIEQLDQLQRDGHASHARRFDAFAPSM